jgi:histidinol-phosphate aminotransferase
VTFVRRAGYERIRLLEFDWEGAEVNLSDNTNRWGAHPAALAVLRAAGERALYEYPTPYGERLEAAIARRFGVLVDWIATGCGSDDVLDCALRALGGPGRRLVFVPPTFSMVVSLALANGLEPVAVERSGAFPGAAALLAERPDVVYLCRPENPTGELLPRSVVEELLAVPDGPVVLLDEAYAEFAGESLVSLAGEGSRSVVLRTMSKAYGLAGLRVGYAIGDPILVREIEKARGPFKVGRLAEEAAVAALESDDEWLARSLGEARVNRERLAVRLRALGLQPLPSAANFLLVPVAGSARSLAAALRERGIAVRAFAGLPGIGDAIRVTVAPWPELERFLVAFEQVLRERGGVR